MNKEITSIINSIRETLQGNPWYGKNVLGILQQANPANVFHKVSPRAHSQAELLYHMINWASFVLELLKDEPAYSIRYFEDNDWISIVPEKHTWEKGLASFMAVHEDIITLLQTKTDDFLEKPVKGRTYNTRFLLNGLIQHNIYHAGQVMVLNKL
ncbi:MAG TPA: DinB family protein [Chitinophagaceae bacterium]|jgi:uncharacterized damage-inducible protein DinB|nr:DinB family protein [Chitinophagaceae bacterium]